MLLKCRNARQGRGEKGAAEQGPQAAGRAHSSQQPARSLAAAIVVAGRDKPGERSRRNSHHPLRPLSAAIAARVHATLPHCCARIALHLHMDAAAGPPAAPAHRPGNRDLDRMGAGSHQDVSRAQRAQRRAVRPPHLHRVRVDNVAPPLCGSRAGGQLEGEVYGAASERSAAHHGGQCEL